MTAGTGVLQAARAMAIDQVTAEVVTALRTNGIESLLLKGPSIAAWLYPTGGRSYGDSDLLVDPVEFAKAARVLRQIGFSLAVAGQAEHAHTYRRMTADGSSFWVDLHRTIPLVGAPAGQVWSIFSQDTQVMSVGQAEVTVLGIPARILHIALHGVQHAFETSSPFEDLRRAITVVDIDAWTRAGELSRALEAEDAFAAGLQLIPEGAAIAEQLHLTESRRGVVRIAASPQSQGPAYHLQRIMDAPTFAERLKLVLDPIVPSPTVLRQGSPLARRGRAGLVLSYALRPVVLVRRMGPALALRRRILKSK